MVTAGPCCRNLFDVQHHGQHRCMAAANSTCQTSTYMHLCHTIVPRSFSSRVAGDLPEEGALHVALQRELSRKGLMAVASSAASSGESLSCRQQAAGTLCTVQTLTSRALRCSHSHPQTPPRTWLMTLEVTGPASR